MKPSTLLGLAIAASSAACGGSSSSAPPTPTPPSGTPGTTQNITLTLVSRNVDQAADAGQIYAYVGDATVQRSQMAALLNENVPALLYIPGASSNQATMQVARGKTVTLFAVEFGANGFGAGGPGEPNLTRAPRAAVEFIGWIGAAPTGEPGVASFVANGDVTVTAEYDRMRSLQYTSLGCRDIKIQTTGPGMLGFGPLVPDAAPDLTSTGGFSGTSMISRSDLHWGYVWAKQGTTITVRARQRESRPPPLYRSGFMRWEGAAASCGTSLNCQLPVPSRNLQTPPGPIKQINSYAENTAPPSLGCGCAPGAAAAGTCTLLP